MKRLFISYSRRNLTFAERLARDLSDAGFDVWIDFRKIKGGQQWRDAIFKGIDQAEVVIVCLSIPAVESEWVRREILMARSQDKLIVPVRVEAVFDAMRQYDETEQLLDVQIIDFENRYERAFPLLLQALPGLQTVTPDMDLESLDPANISNPFKGLEAFQQTDADLFFGREDLTARLAEKLRENRRFLAVVGASGSGKSSLVRAGLIPKIRGGDLPGSDAWPLVIFTPQSEPTKEMAKRLMPVLGEKLLPNLMTALERGPDSLHLLTEGLLFDAPSDARLVLVVDQFEEVFTRASPTEAARFLDLLHTAITIPSGQTLLILTLRADFFDRLSAYPDLAVLFEQENMVIATKMTPDNLRLSIEGPAEMVGLVYDHGLPDRILEEVREQPGSLPLLQFALKELYERRDGRRLTFEAYEEIGGVRRALAQHAEDIFNKMNAAQQDLMRLLLLRLVEVSDAGEATRRKVLRGDLTFRDISVAAVSEVIDQLTSQESRLLVVSREIPADEASDAEPTVWIEISHEAMIREWERFTGWIAANEEELRYGGALLKAAGDWERAERHRDFLLYGARVDRALRWLESADASDLQRAYVQASAAEQERQQAVERARIEHELEMQRELVKEQRQAAEHQKRAAKRLRYLLGALAVFLIIAVVLAGLALSERNNAQDQAATATNALGLSEQRGTAVAQQAGTATLALGQAEQRGTAVAEQAETAVAAEATSESRKDEAQSVLWANSAQQAMNNDNQQLALPLALEAVSVANPPSLAQRILDDVAYAPAIKHSFGVEQYVVWDVAYESGTLISSTESGNLVVWNIETGESIHRFSKHRGNVWRVSLSGDGRRAISVGDDRTLLLWNTEDGKLIRDFPGHSDSVLSVALSDDGSYALAGVANGNLVVWDMETGEIIQHLAEHIDAIQSVALSTDGRFALTGSSDRSLILWDTETWNVVQQLEGHEDVVLGTAISSDGTKALSGSANGNVILWNLQTGQALHRLTGHFGSVWSVALSEDGRFAASGSSDRSIIVWDAETGTLLHRLEGHKGAVNGLDLDADGSRVFSASDDGSVLLWDVQNEKLVKRFGSIGSASSIALSEDGKLALLGLSNGNLTLWDAQTDSISYLEGHLSVVNSVAMDASKGLALSGGDDHLVFLWNLQTQKPIGQFENHNSAVTSVALSANGMWAISGAVDGSLFVWDVETREIVRKLAGNEETVLAVALDEDGQLAMSGAPDGNLILWNARTGDVLNRLEGHQGVVNDVVIDAELQIALSAGDDGLFFWDLEQGDLLRRFEGHEANVLSVALSRENLLVLSGDAGGYLLVWDLTTGELLTRLKGHKDAVYDLALSRDGLSALSLSDSGLYLWNTMPGNFLRRFLYFRRNVLIGLALSGDGHRLLSISNNSALWDVDTGEVLDVFPYGGRQDIQEGETGTSRSYYFGKIALSDDGQTAIAATNSLPAYVWNPGTGEHLYDLHGHTEGVTSVAITSDGRMAISGSADRMIILWDLEQGDLLRRFEGHNDTVRAVELTSDGRWALSGSDDFSAILWNTTDGHMIHRFDGHRGRVSSVAIAPDGKTVLSGSADTNLILWDVKTGLQRRTLVGHNDEVLSAVFSPDGAVILSGAADGEIILWDTATGQPIRRWIGHEGAVTSLVYGSDDSTAFSAGLDGQIIMWRVQALNELITWVYNNRTVRELTCDEREILFVEPDCDELGNIPTRTPYPTLTLTATRPPLDLTLTSATPTSTPLPTPTRLPLLVNSIRWDTVQPGKPRIWLFEGQTAQTISISIRALGIDLDPYFTLYAPDGMLLAENNDCSEQNIDGGPIKLPKTGTYAIEVGGCNVISAGAYEVILKE